jgi:hypothetical protein
MIKIFFKIGCCLCLLPGCMTVSSISSSQVPPVAERQHRIMSSESNLVLLAIPFGNSFVEEARSGLEAQCAQGQIEGILSKHQNTNYFLGLVSRQEVVMEGYCLSSKKKG